MWGNLHDRSNRGASHSGPQRPEATHRPRETVVGQAHGRPPEKNAGPLPHMPSGPPRGASRETKSIMLTNGATPMMPESCMRRKPHVQFGGGQSEKGQPWHLAGCLPYITRHAAP